MQFSLFMQPFESSHVFNSRITKTIPHGKEIRVEGCSDFHKLLFLLMRQIFHQPNKQLITHHKFLSLKTKSPDNTGQWFHRLVLNTGALKVLAQKRKTIRVKLCFRKSNRKVFTLTIIYTNKINKKFLIFPFHFQSHRLKNHQSCLMTPQQKS